MKNLLYSLIAIIAFSTAVYAQPNIEIEGGNRFDWGDVSPNESPLKTTVYITNTGNEVLKISEVKPNCGCTTAPLQKDVLKPGEKSQLDITLNISNRQGRVSKAIRISSNDPNKPNHMLHLVANVKVPLTLSPSRYIRFGNDMAIGKMESASLTLNNTTEKPIKIENVEVSPNTGTALVNIKNGTVIKAGESQKLKLDYTPERGGPANIRIKLTLDNDDQKELIITAYGRVVEENDQKSQNK